VVPADFHDFFAASAGVSGALIGLLFVAISVVGDRLARAEATAQIHRIRAYAALVSFTNTLTVSLFALIPDQIGGASIAVSLVGVAFVLAALLSLLRIKPRRWTLARDAVFLVGLAVVFVIQLLAGLSIEAHPVGSGSVNTIAILVVVCFLLGIARAWELIGGPSIGIGHEVVAMVRHQELVADEAESTQRPGTGKAEAPRGKDAPPA
jgi:hypothetical protein